MFEYLKLFLAQSPKVLFGIALFCTIALTIPDQVLIKIGFSILSDSITQKLWIALLLSTCFLISNIIFATLPSIKNRINEYLMINKRNKTLQNLTPDEKEILEKYILQNKVSVEFERINGVVQALVNKKIIDRSPVIVNGYMRIPYIIQPWAQEYLKKNQKLLS